MLNYISIKKKKKEKKKEKAKKIEKRKKKYSKFEPNAKRGSRVMSIFTKRAPPAKMMLGEASSPLIIPVAGQC